MFLYSFVDDDDDDFYVGSLSPSAYKRLLASPFSSSICKDVFRTLRENQAFFRTNIQNWSSELQTQK